MLKVEYLSPHLPDIRIWNFYKTFEMIKCRWERYISKSVFFVLLDWKRLSGNLAEVVGPKWLNILSGAGQCGSVGWRVVQFLSHIGASLPLSPLTSPLSKIKIKIKWRTLCQCPFADACCVATWEREAVQTNLIRAASSRQAGHLPLSASPSVSENNKVEKSS